MGFQGALRHKICSSDCIGHRHHFFRISVIFCCFSVKRRNSRGEFYMLHHKDPKIKVTIVRSCWWEKLSQKMEEPSVNRCVRPWGWQGFLHDAWWPQNLQGDAWMNPNYPRNAGPDMTTWCAIFCITSAWRVIYNTYQLDSVIMNALWPRRNPIIQSK